MALVCFGVLLLLRRHLALELLGNLFRVSDPAVGHRGCLSTISSSIALNSEESGQIRNLYNVQFFPDA